MGKAGSCLPRQHPTIDLHVTHQKLPLLCRPSALPQVLLVASVPAFSFEPGPACGELGFGLAAAGRRRQGAVSRVWAGWGGRRENTPERLREDRIAPRSSSQERRARSGWWGTGRETAEGVRRVKSSQLPFSIRFCFASSEFRHLHNTLSFQNNVGVPDIELCKQVCSQLSEELLLPPLA